MKRKSLISTILAIVIVVGSLTVGAFAAETVTVVTPPKETNFYEGIDWCFNRNGTIRTYHDLNLDGLVLRYNSVNYPTRNISGFGQNVYAKSLSGTWQVGANKIKIYNFDIPDSDAYAVMTVNFVKATAIELISRPNKTILLQNRDWQMGILNDVEIKDFDTTGAVIKVTFANGVKKTISAGSNALLSWSVPTDVESFAVGPQDLYITYGGLSVPFGAFFATDTVHCPGDINTDNTINSLDALQILKASVDSIVLNTEQTKLADVSGDGRINSLDALKVLQYAVGKINFIYK